MIRLINACAVAVLISALAPGAFADVGSEPSGAAPFVAAIQNEPAAKLAVDQPLADPLARGAVLIPYRVESLRILPLVGPEALALSPRVGHLHVTLDDLPWHWGDFSGANTIVLVGLPAGEHKLLVELADPAHHILAARAVTFTVPATMAHAQ